VIQEKSPITWEAIVWVIVRKKKLYGHVNNSEW